MKRKTIVGLITIVAVIAVAMLAGCVEEKEATPTPTPKKVVSTPTPTLPPIVMPAAKTFTSDDVDEIKVEIFGASLMYLEFKMSDGRTAGCPGSDFYELKLSDGNTEVKMKTYYNSKQLATKTIHAGPGEISGSIDIPEGPEDGPLFADLINVEIKLPNGKKVSEDIEIDAVMCNIYLDYSSGYHGGKNDADRGYSPQPYSYVSDSMGSFEKDLRVDGYYDGYYGFTPRYDEMPEATKTLVIA